MRLPIVLLLSFGPLLAQSQPLPTDGNGWLNYGLQKLSQAYYDDAVDAFQRAVNLDPSNPTANLSLAMAYTQRYVPGANTPENVRTAELAESGFQRVLQLAPNFTVAMSSLAALKFQEAQASVDLADKARVLNEAKDWYWKWAAANPGEKQAPYSIGVIDWTLSYAPRMEARARIGMRPEDPGPIRDNAVRMQLESEYGPSIQEGIDQLNRALQLDAGYEDAMAYMNLLYRARADLDASPEQAQQDTATADHWVEQSLETKRQNPAGLSIVPGLVPPPPPPPPPPPFSGQAAQRIRVGGNVQAANLLTKVDPVYPALAQQARIQGTVRFNVVIDKQGRVQNVQLVSGHPLLVNAAQDAVRQWLYKPTLLNGQPVEVVTTADVNFMLPQ